MIDFTPYLPPYDPQHSLSGIDAYDCVSEATLHSIEMQMSKAGYFKRFSPRALAKMDGTTQAGNNIGSAFQTIKQQGLIPYELWPNLDTFNWDEYYASIPQNILSQAVKVGISLITDTSKINPDIPVILQMWMGSTTHFVVQFNDHQYFDTYQPAIKEIDWSRVKAKYQIIVTQMGQFKTQNFHGELRIVLQAATPDQWSQLCTIYGVDPTKFDETIN